MPATVSQLRLSSESRSIRAILAVHLTERTESDKLIPITLEHELCGGTNEVDIALFDLLHLGTNTDRTAARGADHNTRTGDALECSFGFCRFEDGADDAEFLDGRVVQEGFAVGAVCFAVEFDVGVVDGLEELLLGRVVVVGQDFGEGVDVLEFRGEACANDVVGGGHAFDDVAGDVGVDVVGFEVHGLSRGEFDEVEEEENKEADVRGELAVAALNEFAEFFGGVDAGAGGDFVGGGEGDEVFRFGGDGVFVGLHESGEGCAECGFGVV